MPGLLSNVFGGASDDHPISQDGQDSQEYSASGDAGVELSPTVSVGHEASGSYQNLDGSTTEWSSDTNVTLTVDVDAALGVAGGFDQANATDG